MPKPSFWIAKHLFNKAIRANQVTKKCNWYFFCPSPFVLAAPARLVCVQVSYFLEAAKVTMRWLPTEHQRKPQLDRTIEPAPDKTLSWIWQSNSFQFFGREKKFDWKRIRKKLHQAVDYSFINFMAHVQRLYSILFLPRLNSEFWLGSAQESEMKRLMTKIHWLTVNEMRSRIGTLIIADGQNSSMTSLSSSIGQARPETWGNPREAPDSLFLMTELIG